MVCSLTELARMPDMPSEPKLRRLIAERADFPIVRHGDHGRAYQFDEDAVRSYLAGIEAEAEAKRAARREELRAYLNRAEG